jgi:hypothetical protein
MAMPLTTASDINVCFKQAQLCCEATLHVLYQ